MRHAYIYPHSSRFKGLRGSSQSTLAFLLNDLFKKGISIDKNVKNNVVIDQIHNVFHFKRTLKRHYLCSYSRITLLLISLILCILLYCILVIKFFQP